MDRPREPVPRQQKRADRPASPGSAPFSPHLSSEAIRGLRHWLAQEADRSEDRPKNTKVLDESTEDSELLRQVARGNDAAFDIFFSRYAASVYAFIRRRVDSKDAAEQILVDAFVKVGRLADSYPSESRNAESWLFRIVNTSLIDHFRAVRQRPGRPAVSHGNEWEHANSFPGLTRIVRTVDGLFGQQLTALMAGVLDPKLVGKWTRGEETPPVDAVDRLLHALRIVELLKERQSEEDVQAWFLGRNAQLGGRAPVLVVASDPDRVEDAAHAFLAY